MANREFNKINTRDELVKMSEEELKCWLKAKLGAKWSERDLSILSEVSFKEYQSMNSLSKPLRTDREFFAKMFTRGKISKGISLEDRSRIMVSTKLGPMVGIGVNEETYAQP